MTTAPEDWTARVAAVWTRAAEMQGDDLVEEIDALADERPPAGGLDPYRRSRAVIQLASTLRMLGQLGESEQLLLQERAP